MKSNMFSELSLQPQVLQIVEKLHFNEPTQIQKKGIPAILKGKDVVAQSHTGSGKTHTYLIPALEMIDEDRDEVQFVITAPTRELAMQIYDEIRKMISLADKEQQWTTRLLVGGTDKQRLIKKLEKPPHIIVGTPGRILDMVNENALSIYSASTFIIDEADLMFDLGFIKEVDQLLVRCQEDIQVLVFSATIPIKLGHFFKKYLKNPEQIKIENRLAPETMEHRLIAIRHREKATILHELSQVIHPYLAIIFTNGKEEADSLGNQLTQKGLNVGVLHGGLTPRVRKRVLRDIQNLRYQYIVATDLIARGIDMKGVSHVINASLPKEEHFYIHRVGRTARINMEGTAISLYDDQDIPLIQNLEKKGIQFNYIDVKDGAWQEATRWNKREHRQKKHTSIDKEAWKYIKKPKKRKPGYRKKMKQQQQLVKKQLQKKRGKKR